MPQKKIPLPMMLSLMGLMFGAIACACLGSGPSISGFQATANAAFTQGASAAGTAGAVGSGFAATAAAQATANAAGNTTGAATATTGASDATAAPSTGGGPSDIPLMTGQNTILIANDQLVSYQTKADFASVVTFYKDAMPKNGWKLDTTTSVDTANASVLSYKKDKRTAQVSIATDPNSKQTIVLVTLT